MSPQDSIFNLRKPLWLGKILGILFHQETEPAKLPYGESPSMRQMSIQTIVTGLKTQFENAPSEMPSDEDLHRIATERYESSIANGSDNHLGTASRRH